MYIRICIDRFLNIIIEVQEGVSMMQVVTSNNV